jgi:uncharacterized DUF497 family protein
LNFEWDWRKAATNLKNHGVSFEEAASAFGDWRSITVPDLEHSEDDPGFTSSACPIREICRWFAIPTVARTRVSSAHGVRTHVSENSMNRARKPKRKKETVPNIDFSGGVRGKYAARFAEGTNLVALSPDVAEVFPDSKAVNEALRKLARTSGKTARVRKPSHRSTG